jgi:upstream activation factor subunit UAF30
MATKKAGRKAAKKSPAKKGAAKRGATRGGTKRAAKKSTARKGAAKKATARKGAAKKGGARKATAKKSTAKKGAAKKSATKRKPNPAFMKPMQPSADLAAVVGNNPMPRTEITKKVWAYIKKHNLQDPKERRMINADANLKKVFSGKNKVSMFEMTRHVNNHLK